MNTQNHSAQQHWLVKPATIRKLWWLLGIVLAITVIAQAVIHIHAYFDIDGRFGFYALFGFLSCALMVLFAKLLGLIVKRHEHYYEDSYRDV